MFRFFSTQVGRLKTGNDLSAPDFVQMAVGQKYRNPILGTLVNGNMD